MDKFEKLKILASAAKYDVSFATSGSSRAGNGVLGSAVAAGVCHNFADQQWFIYDTRRGYGFFYDTKSVEEVTIDQPVFDKVTGSLPNAAQSADEQQWQDMWRSYFNHIAIKERINPRLQRQFMPRRFWKYLTEKKS